ncbi:SDR family oxidoreductase [Gordonia rubripertincta]
MSGRTLVMSGGSRGIGLAIATAFGAAGGNVVLLAKTDEPHPKLSGTVHTAVAEVESAGGNATAVVGDVRVDDDVARAARVALEQFGGIDVVVNNASVLNVSGSLDLSLKRFDLMQQVNVRGTFALTQACLPSLLKSGGGHVLTLSPPLNMSARWLAEHPGYMLAKYGMTLAAFGFAAEFGKEGMSSNCLWPQSLIATDAVANLYGGAKAIAHARSPQIMADAAMAIISQSIGQQNGRAFIDVDVLTADGVSDLSKYGAADGVDYDIFVDQPGDEQSVVLTRVEGI